MSPEKIALYSTAIAVAGALLGTVITVIVQTFTGIRQRGLERGLKTFDARLQLYVNLVTEHAEIDSLSRNIRLVKEQGVEQARINEDRDHRLRELLAQEYDEADEQFRRLRAIEHEKLVDEYKASSEKAAQLAEKYTSLAERIEEMTQRLAGTRAAIDLISSDTVRREVQKLDSEAGLGSTATYTRPNFAPFLDAARRDLKIVD